jgi:hypothetical protein
MFSENAASRLIPIITYYLVWPKSQRDYVREGEEYGLKLYLIQRGVSISVIPLVMNHEVSMVDKLPATLPELLERNIGIATALIVMAMFLGFINTVVNAESEKARAIGANLTLISASGQGQMAVVREMIDAKADVNAKDADGQTALMLASQHGHLEVAEFLLANKAEFNLHDVAARGDVEGPWHSSLAILTGFLEKTPRTATRARHLCTGRRSMAT